MRILYFTRDYTTHDRHFLEKIAESRHEVLFLRLENDGNAYEARGLPKGVREIGWPVQGRSHGDMNRLLDRMPALERLIGELKPDLVHAGPVHSCGLLAALAGFHPLMVMSWGSDVLVEADNSPRLSWATEYALRHSDYFVCDSDAVREKVRRLLPYCDERLIQFPWGVDVREFSPGSSNLNLRQRPGWQDAILVLSTRSWEPVYAVDVAVEAFRVALEQEPRLRMVLLGGGSLAPKIYNAIEAAALTEEIYCPGRVAHSELSEYFRAADVYLSCALSDGSSVSLLEAMATGLPAIATDAPGNREWIEVGVNGWLASPSDSRHFAQALLNAARLSARDRECMARASRAAAASRADWHKNIARLLETYDRIEAERKT